MVGVGNTGRQVTGDSYSPSRKTRSFISAALIRGYDGITEYPQEEARSTWQYAPTLRFAEKRAKFRQVGGQGPFR